MTSPAGKSSRTVDIVVASLLTGVGIVAWRLLDGDTSSTLLMYIAIVPIALCLGLAQGLAALASPTALVFPLATIVVIVVLVLAYRVVPNRPLRIVLMTALLAAFSAWMLYTSGSFGGLGSPGM